MKKLAVLILTGSLLISTIAFAKPMAKTSKIERNTIASFVASRELRVVNPRPIEIGYRKWVSGSVCTAQAGAEMRVLGTGGGKVLLLYVPPIEESAISCPPGVMFLMPTRDFLRLKALDDKKKAAEKVERALVRQILSER